MNNGRDCPHGRQVGKCDTCDLIVAELELEKVKAEHSALAAQVKALKMSLSKITAAATPESDFGKRLIDECKSTLAATPQHHLAELRAEAVIKFVSQFEGKTYWNKSINDFISEGYQYAAGIRQEVK